MEEKKKLIGSILFLIARAIESLHYMNLWQKITAQSPKMCTSIYPGHCWMKSEGSKHDDYSSTRISFFLLSQPTVLPFFLFLFSLLKWIKSVEDKIGTRWLDEAELDTQSLLSSPMTFKSVFRQHRAHLSFGCHVSSSYCRGDGDPICQITIKKGLKIEQVKQTYGTSGLIPICSRPAIKLYIRVFIHEASLAWKGE